MRTVWASWIPSKPKKKTARPHDLSFQCHCGCGKRFVVEVRPENTLLVELS